MCQLICVNSRNETINQLLLSALLQTDSATNRDGTGFLCVEGDNVSVWKHKDAAFSIWDLGYEIESNVKGTSPVFGHVRNASAGIDITAENAHPFMLDRFSLAHNGRLYKKDAVVSWQNSAIDSGIASDSLFFLQTLEENGKLHPDMGIVDLLNTTMGGFKGKFALMIYDNMYDKHYIIRGYTADLHMSMLFMGCADNDQAPPAPLGFVVNTNKNSLMDALTFGTSAAQIATKQYIFYTDPVELKKETIYEISGLELVEIGELKENSVSYTPAVVSNPTYPHFTSTPTDSEIPVWKYSGLIYKFMEKHFLTITDIDNLFIISLGIPMGDVTLEDIKSFALDIIPVLSAKKSIRKKLSAVLNPSGRVFPIMYQKVQGLQYPWMMNDSATIDRLIDHIKSINKATN